VPLAQGRQTVRNVLRRVKIEVYHALRRESISQCESFSREKVVIEQRDHVRQKRQELSGGEVAEFSARISATHFIPSRFNL
jgi:hypothetical protein